MHPSVRVRRSTSLLLKIAEMFEESLVLLRERIFLALHRLRRKKLRRMNGERKAWRERERERERRGEDFPKEEDETVTLWMEGRRDRGGAIVEGAGWESARAGGAGRPDDGERPNVLEDQQRHLVAHWQNPILTWKLIKSVVALPSFTVTPSMAAWLLV